MEAAVAVPRKNLWKNIQSKKIIKHHVTVLRPRPASNLMKKILITTTFVLTFLSLSSMAPHTAEALARAVFPDPRQNQPAPAGVSPNISHNVESTDLVAPGIPVQEDTPGAQTSPQNNIPASHGNTLWWILGVLGLAGVIAFVATRKKNETP